MRRGARESAEIGRKIGETKRGRFTAIPCKKRLSSASSNEMDAYNCLWLAI